MKAVSSAMPVVIAAIANSRTPKFTILPARVTPAARPVSEHAAHQIGRAADQLRQRASRPTSCEALRVATVSAFAFASALLQPLAPASGQLCPLRGVELTRELGIRFGISGETLVPFSCAAALSAR